jgi:hypothetical protein
MVSGILYISRAQIGHEATVAHTEGVLRKRYGNGFTLEVVDVLEEPDRADAAHVIATPVLVISNGNGEQRFVGALDNAAITTKL